MTLAVQGDRQRLGVHALALEEHGRAEKGLAHGGDRLGPGVGRQAPQARNQAPQPAFSFPRC